MKKLTYWLFGFSFFVSLVSISIFIFLNMPLYEKELDAEVIVTTREMGFDVNDTVLKFGKVTLGGSSMRRVLMYNNYSFPIRIVVEAGGEVKDLFVYDGETKIEPGETAFVPLSVVVPKDFPIGNYSGNFKFKVLRSLL